jgi:hypothetical protein
VPHEVNLKPLSSTRPGLFFWPDSIGIRVSAPTRRNCRGPLSDINDMNSRHSFDHLVGAGEECRWHVEAEHPGGLGVDDQLDFGRYASVRLSAFVTAPSDQQPLKRPVVARLLRIGWPRSLGLRARSQPTF